VVWETETDQIATPCSKSGARIQNLVEVGACRGTVKNGVQQLSKLGLLQRPKSTKMAVVSLSPRNDTTQIKENKTVTKLHELKPFAPLP
jgi:DNA-binding transcriptional regulator PaaX